MDIAAARSHLEAGGLVTFPTETLWSLSCRADDREAVAKIFALKERGSQTPLAVGFANWQEACQYVDGFAANELAAAFLPGPLTLVVPFANDELRHVAPGRDTLGVRVPDHPIAQALLADGPLVMTSANRHGAPDARGPEDVAHLGVPIVGDEVVRGMGSTVLQPHPWRVFRAGAIPESALAPYKKTK